MIVEYLGLNNTQELRDLISGEVINVDFLEIWDRGRETGFDVSENKASTRMIISSLLGTVDGTQNNQQELKGSRKLAAKVQLPSRQPKSSGANPAKSSKAKKQKGRRSCTLRFTMASKRRRFFTVRPTRSLTPTGKTREYPANQHLSPLTKSMDYGMPMWKIGSHLRLSYYRITFCLRYGILRVDE